MMLDDGPPGVLSLAMIVALALLSVALVLAFARLVRGPSLPDRVVALDLMGVLSVGMIVAYSILSGQSVFLDVAIALALVSFLGTVGVAYYLQRSRPS